MFVTARSPIGRELTDALTRAGVVPGVGDHDALTVDGRAIELPVLERSHPHPGEIQELLVAGVGEAAGADGTGGSAGGGGGTGPALLVADRISQAGRDLLRDAGWSWLDRRGHLRIWLPGVRIETEVDLEGDDARGSSTSPWTPVGLEVALWAMAHPDEEVSARRVAAYIGRSVGGTHEIIGRFADSGLIGRSTRLALMPDLFWETAARWPDDGWTPLGPELPEVATALGPDVLVRVDERAATLGGARIAAAADLPARCYVSGRSVLRRARSLAAGVGGARTFIRVAPVRWLPKLEGFEPDAAHPWEVSHPLVCALRLAADPARGREIVEAWGVVPA
jgi:hypothetical protein